MRPMSVLFRLGGIDIRKAVEYCCARPKEDFTADPNFHILEPEKGLVRMSGFFSIVEGARTRGELPDEVHYLRFEGVDVARGIATVNNSRVYGVDGTNAWDISRADTEARLQNRRLLAVIRKNIPGFENAFVIVGAQEVAQRNQRGRNPPGLTARSVLRLEAAGRRIHAAGTAAARHRHRHRHRLAAGADREGRELLTKFGRSATRTGDRFLASNQFLERLATGPAGEIAQRHRALLSIAGWPQPAPLRRPEPPWVEA